MNRIPVGAEGEQGLLVTPEVAIDFLGDDQARVLSTPHMIAYMEWACRNTIQPYLEPGQDSVGTVVNVRHLAATPVGMSVRFRARVAGVDGNRVQFELEAFDEKEKIGEGTHERFVIDVRRFAARLAQKRTAE
jgi:fluoroacetyl-CoA thioesterase